MARPNSTSKGNRNSSGGFFTRKRLNDEPRRECNKFNRFPIRRVIERLRFVHLRRKLLRRNESFVNVALVFAKCVLQNRTAERTNDGWIHGFVEAVISAGNFIADNFAKTGSRETYTNYCLKLSLSQRKKKKQNKRI